MKWKPYGAFIVVWLYSDGIMLNKSLSVLQQKLLKFWDRESEMKWLVQLCNDSWRQLLLLPHHRQIFKNEVPACVLALIVSIGLHNQHGPGSIVGIATGYGLDGPGIESRWQARFSAPIQTGPGAHPASCTMGTGSLPGVKSGRGVTLTPHPLPVPWSRKSRAIPLLPLWAVRPVQSLSACTRVHFTFTLHN